MAKYVIRNHKLCPLPVLDGVLEKLPKANQLAVETLRMEERGAESFNQIDRYLHKHARALYTRSARANNCILHRGFSCPLSFQDPEGIDDAERPLTFAFAGTPFRPHTSILGNGGARRAAQRIPTTRPGSC